MICYASRTGTKRNLDVMRAAGWRILISRTGVWRTEGFPYALDNGCWTDFQKGTPFDADSYRRLLGSLGGGAAWVVCPDVVANRDASLELTRVWLPFSLEHCSHVLIAVQDGMLEEDVVEFLRDNMRVGIFLGGTTEYKLTHAIYWGSVCACRGLYYHIGRVNSAKRIRLAHAAGAHSIDGTSVTRYAKTLPRLDTASRQPDMLSPRRRA